MKTGASQRQTAESCTPACNVGRSAWARARWPFPARAMLDALIRTVRKGKLVTQTQRRERLARRRKVDHACPLTTGIFVRIASEAAGEDRRDGKKQITPCWRVLRDDGALNEKFPGGAAAQARRLRAEGFALEAAKGKRPPRVRDFQRALVKRLRGDAEFAEVRRRTCARLSGSACLFQVRSIFARHSLRESLRTLRLRVVI